MSIEKKARELVDILRELEKARVEAIVPALVLKKEPRLLRVELPRMRAGLAQIEDLHARATALVLELEREVSE